ncbi:MAG: indolepyruvate ferredoxin oxidoreductase [Chlorobiales bacterium]|nr:indolepyruvate ferredoxin oxidoreductase [Chlorobiales bacterium]
MEKQLLLGAEAIALGAIDAGISGVYAYPGTPSTEITEYIQKSKEAREKGIRSSWSANEKTAYEAALGMSYAGKRSLVCMKHVGLNVAADAFINSAITGVNGGMVLAVADDPSMHSSQNEQDSRVYGKFAMIPVVEPATQQEIYDAMDYAFDLSENMKLPVMLRLTTRLSHSRSGVARKSGREQNPLSPEKNPRKFVLLPQNARIQYQTLLDTQDAQVSDSETSPFNKLIGGAGTLGVMAFGIAYNYVMEVRQSFDLNFPVLKIGQYPLPRTLVATFFSRYEKILVAEEGYPVYEELLRGYFDNGKILGRMNGTLPRTGELNADVVAKALGIMKESGISIPDLMVNRPPELCKGCGHRDMFDALNDVMNTMPEKRVFSDIGCYTLGALPPYNAIHTCVDMGASITMAKGAADAGLRPAVAVIGDSTFTHSGITGLLDAVLDKSPMTIIIADNDTTAMTGGQTSSATGRLFDICKGVGVEEAHIRTIIPLKKNLEENIAVLKEEFAYEGVSVVIAHRECIETAAKNKRKRSQSEKSEEAK